MSKFRVIVFTRQLHSLKVSIWLQVSGYKFWIQILTASIWMQVLDASSGCKFWMLICEYVVTVLTQPDTCVVRLRKT